MAQSTQRSISFRQRRLRELIDYDHHEFWDVRLSILACDASQFPKTQGDVRGDSRIAVVSLLNQYTKHWQSVWFDEPICCADKEGQQPSAFFPVAPGEGSISWD